MIQQYNTVTLKIMLKIKAFYTEKYIMCILILQKIGLTGLQNIKNSMTELL